MSLPLSFSTTPGISLLLIVLPFPALLQWRMSRDNVSALHCESPKLYADVIVPRHILSSFTYLVPTPLAPVIKVGDRVLIPFGRSTVEGAVVALNRQFPSGMQVGRLKEIQSLAGTRPNIPASLFQLSRMVADEYLAPWGQCLRLILPPSPPLGESRPRYVATAEGRTALHAEACPEQLRPLLARIVRRSGGILASTLEGSKTLTFRQSIKQLEERGWVTVHKQPSSLANPVSSQPESSTLPLGSFQTHAISEPDPSWVSQLDNALQAGQSNRILVHAPLEQRLGLFAHAITQAHGQQKSVLIVAGEVARVEWLGRLIAHVVKLPVTLLHGALNESTRLARWEQIRSNPATVLVGTRSAIFAPLRSLGLIWIDGEEDPALKEPQEPRYHARDVAWMRAQTEHALLVLGSSHPSLESHLTAGPTALRAPNESSSQPRIDVVDLRREPSGTVFSTRLLAALRETLARKDRTLLFLNRKGFAGTLVCRDCGWVPRCSSCAVALHYSRQSTSLTCRYCGASTRPTDACPSCGAARIVPVGEGTERIESEATRLFPEAHIIRGDGDTLGRPAAARRLWDQVTSGEWDILIGTQALFERDPLPPVGLTGIVHADSGLNIPDFRAAERTYHILSDAIRLARPAAEGGRVVLQTLLPAHHAIRSLSDWDPDRFYEEELAARQLLGYPPVLHLVSLRVSGKDLSAVEQTARQLVGHLEQAATGPRPSSPSKNGGRSQQSSAAPSMANLDRMSILGPVPAAGRRPRGHYWCQIMAKGQDRLLLHEAVRQSVKTIESSNSRRRVKITVDVDPIEMS